MRKQNGISMVSLIITIIIMLILAGVALSMVMGDQSIVGQATSASDKTHAANAEETVKRAWASAEVAYWTTARGQDKEAFYEGNLSNYISSDEGTIQSVEYKDDVSIVKIKLAGSEEIYTVYIATEGGDASEPAVGDEGVSEPNGHSGGGAA